MPDSLSIRRTWPWLLAALLLHVLPFATRPALIGGDEPHFALMAHSIAVDHDLDLTDDYLEVQRGSAAAGVKRRGTVLDPHVVPHGHRMVFAHPLGLPFLAAPFLWILETLSPGAPPDIVLGALSLLVAFMALVAGWRLLAGVLGDTRTATLITFAIYFATPLWYYSRTFFTEPFVWSFAVLALYSMFRRRWLVASVLLAVTFLIKDVALLIVVPILAFAGRRLGPRRFWTLAAGPGVALVITLIRNQWFYGRVFDTYQPFEVGSIGSNALGILFDLRHGLFVFAPVLLVAVFGWMRRRRAGAFGSMDYGAAIVVGYLVLTSLWIGALGGDCYGPRLLVPTIPAFALPLACVVEASRNRRSILLLIQAAVVAGFTFQLCAAADPLAAMWSASVPDLVTSQPAAAVVAALVGAFILVMIDRRFPTRETVL